MTNGCLTNRAIRLTGHPTSRGKYSCFDPLALVRKCINGNKSDIFFVFNLALLRQFHRFHSRYEPELGENVSLIIIHVTM